MKIVIYTALCGSVESKRNELNDKQAKDDRLQYIAYVDIPAIYNSNIWEIREMQRPFVNPVRNAKIFKIMPHLFFDCDYSIWIDSTYSLREFPERLLHYVKDKDMAVWKHEGRDCIYDEAPAIIGYGYEKPATINEQTQYYFSKGHPTHAGLANCSILVRKHTKEMERLNEEWWAHISRFSQRDQMSFPVVFKDKYTEIEEDKDQFFTKEPYRL